MENRFNVEFETDSEGKPTRIIIPEEMLQHSGSTADDILAHYGVRGMKWGVRRGGLKSRIKGARIDQNQRRTAIVTRAKEGRMTREEKIANAPARILMGKKRFNKLVDKEFTKNAEQKKRIAQGKSTLGDKLEIYQTMSLLDLVVSRQDNKG